MSERDSTAVGRAPEPEEFTNRKLIRPQLSRPDHARQDLTPRTDLTRPDVLTIRENRAPGGRRGHNTADHTHAETFYYQKQIQSKTILTVVLKNGEEFQGTLEWYDRNCIKVRRGSDNGMLLYKSAIKYMYKASEGR